MKSRTTISLLVAAMLAAIASAARDQGIKTTTLRGYLDKMGLRYVPHPKNAGALPMSNGLTRLQSRFLAEPEKLDEVFAEKKSFDTEEAEELGLITFAPDDLDWEDEIRVAIEERTSLSPDALTGMEASLRFAGPETMDTKIYGRLTAWQNWIFQRPNAVGEKGALTNYGKPTQAQFDYKRT